jgi:hypothetical protein
LTTCPIGGAFKCLDPVTENDVIIIEECHILTLCQFDTDVQRTRPSSPVDRNDTHPSREVLAEAVCKVL